MHLELIDWIIVIAFLLLSLLIGLLLKNKASGSLTDYFLGGRNLPWYVAGISMVATTFAADTPLWVTEVIAQHGISGNWLWWNMLIGGVLTTFFFAKLWRRANIVTELELIELRYGGPAAAFLRGFKSIYMGIFLNIVVIGWVNFALMKILQVFFEIESIGPDQMWYEDKLLWIVGGAMVLVMIYSSLSGLLGVAVTDMIQFTIAMTGCIILAIVVLNTEKVGGISGLKAQLPAWRFDFFPHVGEASLGDSIKTYSVGIGAFLTFFTVQWWASWYPGAEPGGGGYIAQRMMSAKNEKHAIFATLFFSIAHYCLRPWPWIIVGLCALVLYPDLPPEEAGTGFVLAMRDYLPAGLKGMLFVAFLAAYMSTISTQLNWGSSYLTNDFYKRFFKPESKFPDEQSAQKDYVQKARLFTVLIMVFAFFATTQISSIDAAAKFLIQCGAGLGMVLILRWYWWRINAWSEIAATLAPFAGYTFFNVIFELEFPESFLLTVGFSTVVWLVVTFITPPESETTLANFYERVRPDGVWGAVRERMGIPKGKSQLPQLALCWIGAIVMIYAVLFFIGDLIFQNWESAIMWAIVGVIGLGTLLFFMRKTDIWDG